jgi:leucyl/phenylalanyl-tRNA--protein transferase
MVFAFGGLGALGRVALLGLFSKAALLALILRLEEAGGPRLLDVQWMTPHLASLGAVEATRAEYHVLLDEAMSSPDAF